MKEDGAECIILGCTEIPMLIEQQDIDLPLINTLDEHCKVISDWITD